ncbi:hypothetical protein BGZ70_006346, partial [Mortierella alpina]
ESAPDPRLLAPRRMNRDRLKRRKDPTIPPSAVTVTTSTTAAFPVSPRRGASAGDTRPGAACQRSSPKTTRPTNPTSLSSARQLLPWQLPKLRPTQQAH